MDPKEEQIRKVINLFREWGLAVKPEKSGLEQILAHLDVTDHAEVRYNYQEVNIISPFYQYMTSTMKVLVALVIVTLLVGGVVYFKLMPNGNEGTIATEEGNLPASENGDDVGALLASLDQEQSEETSLLADGDVESSILAEEGSLLGEINKINKDEL